MEQKLDNKLDKSQHAEAETRGAQAALGVEEGLRRTEEGLARLGGEAHRLSFVMSGLMKEIKQLV